MNFPDVIKLLPITDQLSRLDYDKLRKFYPGKTYINATNSDHIVLLLPMSAMSFPGFPRKELPFWPGGPPPGRFNHFDYKRDQNIRRHYPNYQSPFLRPYTIDHCHITPLNYRPYPYRPYSYAP